MPSHPIRDQLSETNWIAFESPLLLHCVVHYCHNFSTLNDWVKGSSPLSTHIFTFCWFPFFLHWFDNDTLLLVASFDVHFRSQINIPLGFSWSFSQAKHAFARNQSICSSFIKILVIKLPTWANFLLVLWLKIHYSVLIWFVIHFFYDVSFCLLFVSSFSSNLFKKGCAGWVVMGYRHNEIKKKTWRSGAVVGCPHSRKYFCCFIKLLFKWRIPIWENWLAKHFDTEWNKYGSMVA